MRPSEAQRDLDSRIEERLIKLKFGRRAVYSRYHYFGTWTVNLPDGGSVEFRGIDLAPFGNRIPLSDEVLRL